MSRDLEVQSVKRACQILEAFRNEKEILSLRDLMDRTGLPKTTAFRLSKSLDRGGLLESMGKGSYRRMARPFTSRVTRIGYAAGSDSEFSRQLTAGLEAITFKENIKLVSVNNCYSPTIALHNTDRLLQQGVDLVLEHQGYEKIAPRIAARFHAAGIPMIAIEVPHPGAVFFGPDNYRVGVLAGRALGHWTQSHWNDPVEEILLLELPNAGTVPQLRTTGILDGIRAVLPAAQSAPCVRLDGGQHFAHNMEVVRRYLQRRHKKFTLVGAFNDICGVAALRAFEEAGSAPLCGVVSLGGTRPARDELRRAQTRLAGTMAFFPERWGEDLIPLARRILDKQPVLEATFVRYQMLTPNNVDLYYPLDRLVGPAQVEDGRAAEISKYSL